MEVQSCLEKSLFRKKFFFFSMMPLVAKVPRSQFHVIAVDIEYMKRGK